MNFDKLNKTNKIQDLPENGLMEHLTSEEAGKIQGGYIPLPPRGQNWGDFTDIFKFAWGKCGANEVIGPDGGCHPTSKTGGGIE